MIGQLTSRQPEEVVIGSLKMYCESFKASLNAVLSERSTVNGDTLITNRLRRAARLTFSGRLPADDLSITEIGKLNNLIGCAGINIVYRGLAFSDCTLLSYAAEDLGGSFISLTVELAAASPAVIPEEDEEVE